MVFSYNQIQTQLCQFCNDCNLILTFRSIKFKITIPEIFSLQHHFSLLKFSNIKSQNLMKCTLRQKVFRLVPFFTSMFLRRRQKEKRINPPNTSSGGPSSPASPPSMASPGGFFGVQPGGSTTPPTSLTPFSGSPGKNE